MVSQIFARVGRDIFGVDAGLQEAMPSGGPKLFGHIVVGDVDPFVVMVVGRKADSGIKQAIIGMEPRAMDHDHAGGHQHGRTEGVLATAMCNDIALLLVLLGCEM